MYVCFYYIVLVCLFFVCSGVKTYTKETLPYKAKEEGQTQKNNVTKSRKIEYKRENRAYE